MSAGSISSTLIVSRGERLIFPRRAGCGRIEVICAEQATVHNSSGLWAVALCLEWLLTTPAKC
jgi:hypothetical protein